MNKKIVSIMLMFSLAIISLVGCTQRPTMSNQIMLGDKTIGLLMTKPEVDAALGEGTLIKKSEGDNTNYYVDYDNGNISIRYEEQNHDGKLYVTEIEWTTAEVKTFNGLEVGTSEEAIQKKIKGRALATGGDTWGSVYYYATEPYPIYSSVWSGAEGYSDIKAWYFYRFDEELNVARVEMRIVAEISAFQAGTYVGEEPNE